LLTSYFTNIVLTLAEAGIALLVVTLLGGVVFGKKTQEALLATRNDRDDTPLFPPQTTGESISTDVLASFQNAIIPDASAQTSPAPTCGNVLGNPGFENTTASPWSMTGAAGLVSSPPSSAVHSGSWAASVGGHPGTGGAPGVLSQSSVYVPASSALTFWYQVTNACNAATQCTGGGIKVTFGGNTLPTIPVSAVTGWTKYTVDMSPFANTTNTLSLAAFFGSNSNITIGAVVDDFSLTNGTVCPPPSLSISASPTTSLANSPVAFTATGTEAGGAISSYSWTFGDGGTSTSQNPSHTYATAGSYTATCTITDNNGVQTSASKTITVSNPTLSVSANPTSGPANSSIAFTATATDTGATITGYRWAFGDGGTSTAQNPSHTYTATGSFTATCTVTDSNGLQKSAPVAINIYNPPTCQADASANHTANLLGNCSFENGLTSWTPFGSPAWTASLGANHLGAYGAASGVAGSQSGIYQQHVTMPYHGVLTFWYKVNSVVDRCIGSGCPPSATIAVYLGNTTALSNAPVKSIPVTAATGWTQFSADMSPYYGQSGDLFIAANPVSGDVNIDVDDFSLVGSPPPPDSAPDPVPIPDSAPDSIPDSPPDSPPPPATCQADGSATLTANLIANCSFENGLSSWSNYGSPTWTVGKRAVHFGAYGAASGVVSGTSGIYQQVSVPNQATLSFWYKVNSAKTFSGVTGQNIGNFINVYFGTNTTTPSSNTLVKTIPLPAGASGWQQVTGLAVPYGSGDLFIVAAANGGDASIDVDDVSLVAPTLTVNISPGSATAIAGAAVTFTANVSESNGTNPGYTYSWNFGDGTTSTSASPSHTYATPGTYPVTCVVTDANGVTANVSQTVKVSTLTATGSASPSTANVNATINFTVSTNLPDDGEMATYSWSFGDGQTNPENNPFTSHAYATAGNYTATCLIQYNGTSLVASIPVTIINNSSPDSPPSPDSAPDSIVNNCTQLQGAYNCSYNCSSDDATETISLTGSSPVSGTINTAAGDAAFTCSNSTITMSTPPASPAAAAGAAATTGTVTGSGGGVTIHWNNGAAWSKITPVPAVCQTPLNVIQNCGFETGNFTSWKRSGSNWAITPTHNTGNWAANSMHIQFPNSATLSQHVNVPYGGKLSFWYEVWASEPTSRCPAGTGDANDTSLYVNLGSNGNVEDPLIFRIPIKGNGYIGRGFVQAGPVSTGFYGDMTPYGGKPAILSITAQGGCASDAAFFLDDIMLVPGYPAKTKAIAACQTLGNVIKNCGFEQPQPLPVPDSPSDSQADAPPPCHAGGTKIPEWTQTGKGKWALTPPVHTGDCAAYSTMIGGSEPYPPARVNPTISQALTVPRQAKLNFWWEELTLDVGLGHCDQFPGDGGGDDVAHYSDMYPNDDTPGDGKAALEIGFAPYAHPDQFEMLTALFIPGPNPGFKARRFHSTDYDMSIYEGRTGFFSVRMQGACKSGGGFVVDDLSLVGTCSCEAPVSTLDSPPCPDSAPDSIPTPVSDAAACGDGNGNAIQNCGFEYILTNWEYQFGDGPVPDAGVSPPSEGSPLDTLQVNSKSARHGAAGLDVTAFSNVVFYQHNVVLPMPPAPPPPTSLAFSDAVPCYNPTPVPTPTPAPAGPTLTFWYNIQSGMGDAFIKVKFNSNVVSTISAATVNGTTGWLKATVDMSSYAGQTGTLAIQTNDELNSGTVEIYFDDFTLKLNPPN